MTLPRNTWALSPATPERADLRRPALPERPVSIPALPQSLTIDASRTALVVVDMQNDFCHRDGWLAGIGVDVAGASGPIAALRDLLPLTRAAGVPVLWVNWGNRPDRANLPPNVTHVYDPTGAGVGIGSTTSPAGAPVLELGSWGAAVVEELVVDPSDLHIDKYRMSGFVDTMLDSVLRNLRVDTLLFAGVNSDQCVYATLVDAANLGYDVVLLEDAAATTSPAYCHDATLYNVRQCFGFTSTATALGNAWEGLIR